MKECDRVTRLNASLEDFQANIFNAVEDLKAYRTLLRKDDGLEIFLIGTVTAHIHTLENIRKDLAIRDPEEEQEPFDGDGWPSDLSPEEGCE